MKKLLRRFFAALCAFALCLTFASALSVEDARMLLEKHYVGTIPAAAYEATTLDELFKAVGDPYTYYMSAAEWESFNDAVEKETSVSGIGAGIEYTADGILLTEILPGGGAEEAGLTPGDCIVAIEGVPCAPANDTHRALIIGEAGTYVSITVRHADGTRQNYRIERRLVELHNTTVTSSDEVTTISCSSFGTHTADYFYNGILEYGRQTRLWVIDLRNNMGGISDAAVSALGMFTGFGPKLIFRTNEGTDYATHFLYEPFTEAPVIVLVNARTASASEIFSGGIRAQSAGVIVGSRTYGKGVAQLIYGKADYPELFADDAIKITTHRFYCSDGDTTDRIGVIPTILVSDKHAPAVAELLCGERDTSRDTLRLTLNQKHYFIDLEKAVSAPYRAAFSELLSALTPDATALYLSKDGAEISMRPDAVAEKLDIELTPRTFRDVEGSDYASEINTLGIYRILLGSGDREFAPTRTLTRAELCAMLAQALNVSGGVSGYFTDIPVDRWYSDPVNAIASLGFVDGVGGGRFDPDGTLTQSQFIAVMGRLTRFLNCNADDYARELTEEQLADASLAALPAWARTEASILTGYDGNLLYTELAKINPDTAVTREQAAATLCRILKGLNLLSY